MITCLRYVDQLRQVSTRQEATTIFRWHSTMAGRNITESSGSAELPNGMTLDLFGPMSFRRNDLEVLQESNLNDRLVSVHDAGGLYALYGDGIFVLDSCILRSHVGNNLIPRQIAENKVMAKMRIAI